MESSPKERAQDHGINDQLHSARLATRHRYPAPKTDAQAATMPVSAGTRSATRAHPRRNIVTMTATTRTASPSVMTSSCPVIV